MCYVLQVQLQRTRLILQQSAKTPPARTPSTQSVSSPGTPRVLDPIWFEQYEISFSHLSAPLRKAILEKKRPSPRDRRQMLRIIVDDIV